MRAVVQRAARGSVSVSGETVGSIQKGLVVLLGIGRDDTEDDVLYLAEKITNLRIFEDDEGRMNLSVLDITGDILAVSQFTLYGDCRKGRRPSFIEAAPADKAERLYQRFVEVLTGYGLTVSTGRFQTTMLVEIYNEGPVTILLDSRKNF